MCAKCPSTLTFRVKRSGRNLLHPSYTTKMQSTAYFCGHSLNSPRPTGRAQPKSDPRFRLSAAERHARRGNAQLSSRKIRPVLPHVRRGTLPRLAVRLADLKAHAHAPRRAENALKKRFGRQGLGQRQAISAATGDGSESGDRVQTYHKRGGKMVLHAPPTGPACSRGTWPRSCETRDLHD